jgi:Flp pilus assembly pilin Flp
MSRSTLAALQSRRNRRGQTMAEYVLIVGTIAIVAIAAYALFGRNLANNVNHTNSAFTAS